MNGLSVKCFSLWIIILAWLGRKLGDFGFHCSAEHEIRWNLSLTNVYSLSFGALTAAAKGP